MATTYTFADIKVEVAENVGYDDGVGGFQSSKDLTEAMIGKYVNRRYYELVSILAGKYPSDFERIAVANFYKVSGTVSTLSTTTLTATGAIFTSDMLGDTVYNSTRTSSAVIASVTSSTVVVLTTEPTTWVSTDTIYVLGHEFALGGNASDSIYPIRVGVKYSTSDTYYRESDPRSSGALSLTGAETYFSSSPVWYPTNVNVGGVNTPAIGILPEPTLPISLGLRLTYLELPPKLSSDSDVPRLPLGSQHRLISGATIDALRKLKRFDETVPFEADWKIAKAEVTANYARSKVLAQRGEMARNDYNLRTRRK